jgi:hypothetical protein
MRALYLSLFVLTLATQAFANDLTIGWISRSPEIDFVWNSANPRVEGWPAPSQPVTWRAHIRNFGPAQNSVGYRWTIDGGTVASGRINLAADSTSTIDLPWSWTFDRRRIAAVIDTDNVVSEESETNNRLEVFSDALAVGFWVEQSIYDYFRANQGKLGIGSTSWDNWAQRHIDLYNDMAAMAVYPETPNGVIDRWRLQKIVIVPDGSLPLAPLEGIRDESNEASGSTHPDVRDRSVDLMWGFRTLAIPTYGDHRTVDPANPFYFTPILIHELGHARYLTDVYGFNVHNDGANNQIGILENGMPIAGWLIPGGRTPYQTPEQGLMNKHLTFIDRYSAIALNRIAGRRAISGNYNDPWNGGEFLNDLPAQNRITIRDANGNVVPDANVWIYQSTGGADAWYSTNYDSVPDLQLRTDASGRVLVGRNPFSSDGVITHYWRKSNSVAIVRVEKGGRVEYGFLEVRLFNMAYWRGQTAFADHELTVGANFSQCGSDGPVLIGPRWDRKVEGPVTLQWGTTNSAEQYLVWTWTDGSAPRLAGTTSGTSMTINASGRTWWWVEARGGICGSRRSGPGRFEAAGASTAGRRRTVRR